ncbi:MAG: deoxyguanosinetriphosphate triphosphohydrolase [Rhizobacter sp.]|jgi:dGTPase|nr:deoxyguanosinetriphosphate triphosphohydrolase [Rhizobacter sp.]
MLQPYASHAAKSRGRRHPELPAPTRDAFQRDRDRIVHSTAFRRLVYKTQVFLNHEGDLFRTRLTHSLEVAQLGRSIGRALGLNEDLIEAIALAHDLGHTPFGHAGQDALNECMKAAAAPNPRPDADTTLDTGFEHNLQSLRVVDELEERYPAYNGLNLSFETREGILKHCSRSNARRLVEAEPDGPGRRFLDGTRPSLEAQLCNLADEIAYNAHDIDDGVRSGLLALAQLEEVPLFDRFRAEVVAEFPALASRRVMYESIRRMLSAQVYDVIDATRAQLEKHRPADENEVRRLPMMVAFSREMADHSAGLKRFLWHNLYRHPQVEETTGRAKCVIRELFHAYRSDPAQMPEPYGLQVERNRAIADYIAGMTDRFALREHERLTGRRLFD